MNAVIETRDLTRRFGEKTAVDRLTLTVYAGEVFGLLGHNGAGKTTTVRLLNGVLNPSGGSARVLGFDPIQQGADLRRRTGVLTETPSLYEGISARQNLRLFADLYGVPRQQVERRVEAMLEHFKLADRAQEKVGGYSKGMKQRLALARAFLHQPDILFLDEPTAGLDPVAAKDVNDLIVQVSRDEGKTVLLATHNLHDAQRLCDRVAVLEMGHIVALGTPRELAHQTHQSITVEIEVADGQAERAKTLLDGVVGEIKGDKLVLTNVAYTGIPDVVARLVSAQIAVYSVVPNEPTLEDVYFTLQKRGESS
jgi:ABC-2 type transport system ATP-binding protein